MPKRDSKIAALAANVADHYSARGLILPDVIAQAEAIEVTYGTYGNEFDGLIDYANGKFHIRRNLDRENLPNSPRGRFTLAH